MQQPSVLVFQQIMLTGQSVAAMKRQRFGSASASLILLFIYKTARDAKGDASRSSFMPLGNPIAKEPRR